MFNERSRSFPVVAAALIFSFMCVSSVWANDEEKEMEDPFEGQPPMTDQFKQFSNEIAKRVHQEVQQLLARELKLLKESRNRNRYTAEERIAKQEMKIKDDPKDAGAHFALGEVYDEIRDGANAIIHMQIAEQLFKEQKNVKGLAESRRNLRWYFEKYDYKREDFLLN